MLSQKVKKALPYIFFRVGNDQLRCYSKRHDSGLCLKDKVVLITGAGSGIGAATAMAFAKEGSKVVIVDRDADSVKKVAETCQNRFCAETLAFQVDVTDNEGVAPMFCDIIKKIRTLDVLVNNAGILTLGSILKGDLMEAFDKTLKVNLRACLYVTTLAAPYLVQTKGNIINVSSILGRTYAGDSKYLPYCISQAGLDHFMHGAALELGCFGVRVNNVCPGPTKTEMYAKAGVKKSWKEIAESFRIDDVSEPSDIADLIVYLASVKAKSITGVRYYIDRGSLIKG